MKQFLYFFLSFLPCITFAQSAYMHEVAEDAEGSPMIIIFIIIAIWVIYNFNSGNKDNTSSQKEGKKLTGINKSNNDFNQKCIDIYCKYIEIVGDYLLFKENGNYSVIPKEDKRYSPLHEHIKKNYLNRTFLTSSNVNIDLLNFYIRFCIKEGKLNIAIPIENNSIKEDDLYGGRTIVLKMYYDPDFEYFLNHFISNYPQYSLDEYIIRIGFDLALHLQKKIKTPIDTEAYRRIRNAQRLGIPSSKYTAFYIQRFQIIEKTKGEYYDIWEDKYLGNSWKEAYNKLDKERECFSVEEAIQEIRNIKWEL